MLQEKIADQEKDTDQEGDAGHMDCTDYIDFADYMDDTEYVDYTDQKGMLFKSKTPAKEDELWFLPAKVDEPQILTEEDKLCSPVEENRPYLPPEEDGRLTPPEKEDEPRTSPEDDKHQTLPNKMDEPQALLEKNMQYDLYIQPKGGTQTDTTLFKRLMLSNSYFLLSPFDRKIRHGLYVQPKGGTVSCGLAKSRLI